LNLRLAEKRGLICIQAVAFGGSHEWAFFSWKMKMAHARRDDANEPAEE
jgi:hypothetical protein